MSGCVRSPDFLHHHYGRRDRVTLGSCNRDSPRYLNLPSRVSRREFQEYLPFLQVFAFVILISCAIFFFLFFPVVILLLWNRCRQGLCHGRSSLVSLVPPLSLFPTTFPFSRHPLSYCSVYQLLSFHNLKESKTILRKVLESCKWFASYLQ